MFEKFTEQAIKTIMLSQEESRRLGHNYVGTDFIMLGLIGEDRGIASKVLKSKGVALKDARDETERKVGRGAGVTPVEIPFTQQTKRMLEKSFEFSKDFGHNYICTEHLLLALIEVGDDDNAGDDAVSILSSLGVNTNEIKAETKEAAINRQPAQPVYPGTVKIRAIQLRPDDQLDQALEKARDTIWHAKNIAIQAQEFEIAAWLREKESELNARIKKNS